MCTNNQNQINLMTFKRILMNLSIDKLTKYNLKRVCEEVFTDAHQ